MSSHNVAKPFKFFNQENSHQKYWRDHDIDIMGERKNEVSPAVQVTQGSQVAYYYVNR